MQEQRAIVYVYDGKPRQDLIMLTPVIGDDGLPTGEFISNLEALVAALPAGTEYEIVSPGEADAEAWWAAHRSVEEQTALFTMAIQKRLDDFAAGRNYDNALACATYATSTNPRFAAEGQYMVEARDATWAKGYEILDAVLAGERPMPTIEDVMAELPPLAWPDNGGA